MSDIVEEPRALSGSGDCPKPENMANEDKPCPYVTGKTTLYCTLTTFTLTDAERDAVASCIADDEAATAYERAATLRGLLERL